jgi:hypothetical protein
LSAALHRRKNCNFKTFIKQPNIGIESPEEIKLCPYVIDYYFSLPSLRSRRYNFQSSDSGHLNFTIRLGSLEVI